MKEVVVDYRDVSRQSQALDEMLAYTQGERRIPVIVEQDRVRIGFAGGT
jgi:hypothetical protein